MTATSILSPVKFCKKCQCETERGGSGRCVPCAKIYMLAWRAKNQEHQKATNAAWYAANPDRAKVLKAEWYANNSDKAKAYASEWSLANSERRKARVKARYLENPEPFLVSNQNRRALRIKNGGELSTGLPSKLFALQRGKCACCGLPLGSNYHMDHIMPLALGGSNTDDNIQLLRQRCNNQKHAKHPIDFMQSRGFLL